ncbi:MAG: hypothetical protein HKN53_05865 [Maribacter sp.]|nr:hypothetical protein [Maribacter sp.]
MELEIDKIVIFKNHIEENQAEDKGIDVMVELNDNQKYLSTFFSYRLVNKKIDNSKKYLWRSNMILSFDYQLDTIKWIVNDMLDTGDFYLAFEKLK